jgi:hypothetical protein
MVYRHQKHVHESLLLRARKKSAFRTGGHYQFCSIVIDNGAVLCSTEALSH